VTARHAYTLVLKLECTGQLKDKDLVSRPGCWGLLLETSGKVKAWSQRTRSRPFIPYNVSWFEQISEIAAKWVQMFTILYYDHYDYEIMCYNHWWRLET